MSEVEKSAGNSFDHSSQCGCLVACVACGSEQIKIGSAAALASARSAVEY